jgi:hypothetical protein
MAKLILTGNNCYMEIIHILRCFELEKIKKTARTFNFIVPIFCTTPASTIFFAQGINRWNNVPANHKNKI